MGNWIKKRSDGQVSVTGEETAEELKVKRTQSLFAAAIAGATTVEALVWQALLHVAERLDLAVYHMGAKCSMRATFDVLVRMLEACEEGARGLPPDPVALPTARVLRETIQRSTESAFKKMLRLESPVHAPKLEILRELEEVWLKILQPHR